MSWLKAYSQASTPAESKKYRDGIQAIFHKNVNYVLAGQFAVLSGVPLRSQGYDPFQLPGVLECSPRVRGRGQTKSDLAFRHSAPGATVKCNLQDLYQLTSLMHRTLGVEEIARRRAYLGSRFIRCYN